MDYDIITTRYALLRVIHRCRTATALDFETTSLRPVDGRVRLAQLRNDEVRCVIDFDQIPGGFAACAGLFIADGPWVVFNSGFEMRWFLAAGATPEIIDVLPFFQLRLSWNPGMSFSLFNSGEAIMVAALLVVTIGITTGLTVWMWRTPLSNHPTRRASPRDRRW